jgi:transglutaminase-like putative cysteine protease
MRWAVSHRTTFRYDGPVSHNFNEARLRPADNPEQRLEYFYLTTSPSAAVEHHFDFYGNWVDRFEVFDTHTLLETRSEAVVETRPPPPLPEDAAPAPLARIGEAAQNERCYDFLQPSRFTDTDPATGRLALGAAAGRTDVWQAALAIMRFVHSRLEYQSCSTHVHTPMRDVLAQGRGVCQDFAHVMIGLSRSAQIPARYVSGYLATESASATHAWTEVFIPTIGWRALDPTHNRQPDESYVKIAVGRDYDDVPPLRGTYRGTLSRRMEVDVRITPASRA